MALAGLVALAALIAGALAFVAFRRIEGAELRDFVRAEAMARLGRDAGYESLTVAFSPLRAELTGVFLASSEPGEPHLLEGPSATFPIDVGSLLAGRPELGALSLPEATLRPAADLELTLRDLRVGVRRAAGAVELDARASIQPAGSLVLRGDPAPGGTLEVELDAVDLAALRDAFRSVKRLEGTASGRIRIGGPHELDAALDVPDMRLRIDDVVAKGPVRLELALAPGTFRIDATRALLETRGPVRYRKQPGSPGEVSGRVVRRAGGSLDLVEAHLSISSR